MEGFGSATLFLLPRDVVNVYAHGSIIATEYCTTHFAGGLTEAGALVFGPGSKADSISQIGRGLPKLSPEQASVNNI